MITATPYLQIHSFLPYTLSNGPGIRCCLWLQGCTLACPGCFNPATHDPSIGTTLSVDHAYRLVTSCPYIKGVTISGGEPFQQARPLLELLTRIRNTTSFSTIVFTGYTMAELSQQGILQAARSAIDVLIAGRYVQSLDQAENLIGSTNQIAHFFTNHYKPSDFANIPAADLSITADGTITASGINPARLAS